MNYKKILELRERLDSKTNYQNITEKIDMRFCPWEEMVELVAEGKHFYLQMDEAKKLHKLLNSLFKGAR